MDNEKKEKKEKKYRMTFSESELGTILGALEVDWCVEQEEEDYCSKERVERSQTVHDKISRRMEKE